MEYIIEYGFLGRKDGHGDYICEFRDRTEDHFPDWEENSKRICDLVNKFGLNRDDDQFVEIKG